MVNGDGPQGADEPGDGRLAEQGLAGQETQVPPAAQADEDRVERALMVGDEQRRSRPRHALPALGAQAEAQGHGGHAQPVDHLVEQIGKPVLHSP